jgi:hypothetical protein
MASWKRLAESDYTIGDVPVRTRATAKSRKCGRAQVRVLLAEPGWYIEEVSKYYEKHNCRG